MFVAQCVPLAALATVAFASLTSAPEITTEPLSKVQQNVDQEKADLVHAREMREWDEGHFEGAIVLRLSAALDGLSGDELMKFSKHKILDVHGVVGTRALTAGNAIKEHGVIVRVIKPGYKEVVAAGFPTAKRE